MRGFRFVIPPVMSCAVTGVLDCGLTDVKGLAGGIGTVLERLGVPLRDALCHVGDGEPARAGLARLWLTAIIGGDALALIGTKEGFAAHGGLVDVTCGLVKRLAVLCADCPGGFGFITARECGQGCEGQNKFFSWGGP